MTVKEAIAVLKGAKAITLAWGGFGMPIDPDDEIAMAAFGDFKVDRIYNSFELDTYELNIAVKFIKKGVDET